MQIDAILSFISVIILAGVGSYVFLKGTNKISENFLRLILFLLLWALGNGMASQARSLGRMEEIIFWDNILFLGIAFVPAGWFHLSSIFTSLFYKKKYIIFSYAFSAFFYIFYISGALSWYPHSQDPNLLNPNNLYWLFVSGSFLIILGGTYQYALHYKRSSGKQRKQTLIMLSSVIMPIAGNVLYNVYLLFGSPLSIDPTIPSFAVTGILFAYGITYLQLFEVTIFDPSFVANLFDNLNDAVFYFSKEGRLLITNPESKTLTGYSNGELMGMEFVKLIDEREREELQKRLHGLKKENPTLGNMGLKLAKKDGEKIDVEAGFKLQEKGGEVAGILCVMKDITERKRNEEKLAAIHELNQKMSLSLDGESIAGILLDASEEVFNFGNVALLLLDEEKGELATAGRRGFPENVPALNLPISSEVGLAAACVREGKTIYVPDVSKDKRYYGEAETTRSNLLVPLKAAGKIVGVLDLESPHLNAFSDEDIRLVQTLASSAAIGLENAKLYEETRRRTERLAIVNRIAKAASSTLLLEELMETVYKEVSAVFHADAFFIALHDKKTDELYVPYTVDEGIRGSPIRIPLGVGLISKVFIEKKPLIIKDYKKEIEQLPQTQPFGTMKLPVSWLGVPMIVGDRVIGVLSVQSYRPFRWNEEDKLLLYTISEQVAIALENARLFEETQHEIAERKKAEEKSSKNRKKIVLLHDVALKMEGAKTKEEIYNLAMDAAGEILNFSQASIQYVEDDYLKIAVTTEKIIQEGYRMSIYEGIGGKTYRSGKSFLVEDIAKDRDVKPTDENFRSLLSIPIGKFGVFQAFSYEVADFKEEDLEVGELLASHINEALKRIKSEEKLMALYELSNELTLTTDLEMIFEKVLDACQKVLNFKIVGIFLKDEGKRELYLRTHRNYPEEARHLRFSLDGESGITTWVANHGQLLLVGDVTKDPRYVKGDANVRSELAAPIRIGDKVIGVLNVESETFDGFSEEDGKLLETLASQTAVAIENARLYEEIRKTTDHLKNIVEGSADAIIAVDREGKILTFNRGAEVILGYEASEVLGKSVERYYPDGVAQDIAERLDERGDKKIVNYETVVIGRGGMRIPVSLSAALLFDDKGQSIGSLGIFRDLREKKKYEEKLSTIYELSKEITLSMNIDDIFKKVMDACEKVLDFKFVSIHLVDEKEEVLRNVALGGFAKDIIKWTYSLKDDKGIVTWTAKNGKSAYVPDVSKDPRYVLADSTIKSELAVPLKIGERTFGVLNVESEKLDGFSEDDVRLLETLASQVAIATENARLFEEAARSDRLKEMFISIMSHDLKNPLTIVRGYNELLSSLVEEKARGYTRKIEENVLRMVNMIDTARLYSRLREESYRRDFQECDLGEILESVLKSLSEKASQKNISIIYEKKNPRLLAHKTIESVFLNIIDNAIKYSPAGSNVEIDVEDGEDKIEILIKDFGKGIPDDFKEKIFDKFERGKVEGIEGSGLGLAIAREIVVRHGGKIWVEDNKPQGSVFVVELPRMKLT